jgi:predicted nucleotidyltransferase
MNEMNPVVEQLRFAKNSNHPNSDLDVLYDLEENARLSFQEYILLEEAISKQTGITDIDLVRQTNMNPLVWLTVKDTVIYV